MPQQQTSRSPLCQSTAMVNAVLKNVSLRVNKLKARSVKEKEKKAHYQPPGRLLGTILLPPGQDEICGDKQRSRHEHCEHISQHQTQVMQQIHKVLGGGGGGARSFLRTNLQTNKQKIHQN